MRKGVELLGVWGGEAGFCGVTLKAKMLPKFLSEF